MASSDESKNDDADYKLQIRKALRISSCDTQSTFNDLPKVLRACMCFTGNDKFVSNQTW